MRLVSCEIRGGDFDHGGAASRALKEQLKKVGADPAVIRRATIAAYEAEMNVVIHARRGRLLATLEDGQLDIKVVDRGPGIKNVDQAMKEGFSTAPAEARALGFGAGMGLPNIKKNSDHLVVESSVGRGTRVLFSLKLRPQALYGVGRHSVRAELTKCRASTRCLHACPTQAIRTRHGRPELLDYLCIDCTECSAVCNSAVWSIRGVQETLASGSEVIVVHPASLVQFGAAGTPDQVLEELHALGYTKVCVTAAWDHALRDAVTAHAAREAATRPVISPACPAVLQLIETRFPMLIPHVAPFVTALEALAAWLPSDGATFVVACPAQKTAIDDLPQGNRGFITPSALQTRLSPGVLARAKAGRPVPTPILRPGDLAGEVLEVTGVDHVRRILEEMEMGLLTDVAVIELWACDGACFGSPLFPREPMLSRRRWDRYGGACARQPEAHARQRSIPLSPRAGLRLDTEMSKAMLKLARIDQISRRLPGADCGLCGAPTCAAFAEDVALGRAVVEGCVRLESSHSAEKSP